MTLTRKFRGEPRHGRRDRLALPAAAPAPEVSAGAPDDGLSAADVLKPVPDPDWAMPVPAAQVEAERAASGPQPVLRHFQEGAHPAEDVPQSWARTGEDPYEPAPQPTFTPAPEDDEDTGPRPEIFEEMRAAFPVRRVSPLPPPPAPGASTILYSGPGWTSQLMRVRVGNGEWEELPRLVEEGMGRNAAEAAAGMRHSREKIVEAARQFCGGIGCPEMTRELLNRVSELNAAGGAR